MAIAKSIAGGMLGGAVMLSEGVHLLVDTGTEGLLLYGMQHVKAPADERIPFVGGQIYNCSFSKKPRRRKLKSCA